MKNFCNVIYIVALSMIALLSHAADKKSAITELPYTLQLIYPINGATVTPPANGTVVYLLTNKNGPDKMKTSVDNKHLPKSVIQVTTLPAPYNYQPACNTSAFYLNEGQSCYILYTIDSSQAVGLITGIPKICMSGNTTDCMIVGSDYFSVNITSGPAQDIPITVAPAGVDPLVLGAQTTWTITNQCGLASSCSGFPNTTANAIDVTFSLGGANAFVAGSFVNNCGTLLAGQSCTITATVSSAPPSGTPQTFEAFFQGTNTTQAVDFPTISSVSGVLTTSQGNITVSSATSGPAAPASQCALWFNSGTSSLSISNITAGPNVSNITLADPPVGSVYPTCNNATVLAAGGCEVCYIGAPNAYGSDLYTIIYSAGGPTLFASSAVSVIGTSLLLNNGVTPLNIQAPSSNVSVPIENVGPFEPSPDFNVSITGGSVNNTTFTFLCTSTDLMPNATCNFDTYSTTGTPSVTGSPNFTAAATNLILGAQSIPITTTTPGAPTATLGETHLQYQEIFVTNNSGNSISTSAALPGMTGYAYLCQQADPLCDYPTTCTGTLATGTNCSYWVRSLVNDSQSIGSAPAPGTLTVTLGVTPFTFTVNQDLILFATGKFDTANGSAAANIAQWDASNWSQVGGGSSGGGLNAPGNALTIYKGDMYVGGTFTTANFSSTSPYIAIWNGTSFLPVSASSLKCTTANCSPGVFALAAAADTTTPSSPVYTGELLYIGGLFTHILPSNTSASSIAQWDGSALKPINDAAGNGVFSSLSAFPTVLHIDALNSSSVLVGGLFDTFQPPIASQPTSSGNIALWSTANWISLNSGVGLGFGGSFVTDILTLTGGTQLAATGDYSCINGCFNTTATPNIGSFATGSWSTDGSYGFNNTTNAITLLNAAQVVGGSFTCDTNTTPDVIYRVATLNNAGDWVQLGNGLGAPTTSCATTTDNVQVLTSYNSMTPILFAGGAFAQTSETTNPTTLNNIAQFTGTTSTWQPLTGSDITHSAGNPSVNDILITNVLTVTSP